MAPRRSPRKHAATAEKDAEHAKPARATSDAANKVKAAGVTKAIPEKHAAIKKKPFGKGPGDNPPAGGTTSTEEPARSRSRSPAKGATSSRSRSPAKKCSRSRSRSPVKETASARPRSPATHSMDEPSSSKDVAATAEVRPRGRPPKDTIISPGKARSTSKSPTRSKEADTIASPKRRGRPPKDPTSDGAATTRPSVDAAKGSEVRRTSPHPASKTSSPAVATLPPPADPETSTDSPPKKRSAMSPVKSSADAIEPRRNEVAAGRGTPHAMVDSGLSPKRGTATASGTGNGGRIERKSRSPSSERSKSSTKASGKEAPRATGSRSQSPSKDHSVHRTSSRSPTKRKTRSRSHEPTEASTKSPDSGLTPEPAPKVANAGVPRYVPTAIPADWVMLPPKIKKADADSKSKPKDATPKPIPADRANSQSESREVASRLASTYEKRYNASDEYGEALRDINHAAYKATLDGDRADNTRVPSVSSDDEDRARRSGISRGELQNKLNGRKKGERPGDEDERADDNDDGGAEDDEDDGSYYDPYSRKRVRKPDARGKGAKDKGGRPPPRGRARSRSRSPPGSGTNEGRGATTARGAASLGKERTASPAKERPASAGGGRGASPVKQRAASPIKNPVAPPPKERTAPSAKERSRSPVKDRAAPSAKEGAGPHSESRRASPGPHKPLIQAPSTGKSSPRKSGSEKPYTPGRGKIHSVTNPEFIPETKIKNPFFETLPAPEVWHRRMPPYFTAGETPFMENAISRQIDAELEQGQGKDRADKRTSMLSRVGGTLAAFSTSISNSVFGSSTANEQPATYPPKWDLPAVSDEAIAKAAKEIKSVKASELRGKRSPSRDEDGTGDDPERPPKRSRHAEEYLMSGALG